MHPGDTIGGLPYRVNPHLRPRTITIYDKGKPTAFLEVDSMETLRDVIRAMNDLPEQEFWRKMGIEPPGL